jgi:hypothetical protein
MFALGSPPRGNNFLSQQQQIANNLWDSSPSTNSIEQSLRDVETKIRESHRASARNQVMSLTGATSAAGVARASPVRQQQYFKMVAAGNEDLMFSTSAAAFTTTASTINSVRFDRFGFRLGGVRGAMLRSGGGGAAGGGGGLDTGAGMTPGRHRALMHRDNLRLQKWIAMKDSWTTVLRDRRRKLASRVRKGVPMVLRGEMWCKFTGAQARAQDRKCCDVYTSLLHVESQAVPWEKAIMHEVARIYSSHTWFATRGGQAQRTLFRVLRSLSLHRPDVGYTTSVGFLAAFFLLFMNEQHAFWVLDIVLSDALPGWCRGGAGSSSGGGGGGGGGIASAIIASASGSVSKSALTWPLLFRRPYGLHNLYSDGVPKLLVHLQVLDALLASCVDAPLAAHFAEHGVHAHMWAFDWFSSLFTSSFPLAVTVRVIDVFLFQGSWEVCYRTALATVQSDRRELLRCGSFQDIMARLNVLPARIEDGELLIERAWGLKRMPKVVRVLDMERQAAEVLMSAEGGGVVGGGSSSSAAASSAIGAEPQTPRLEDAVLEDEEGKEDDE